MLELKFIRENVDELRDTINRQKKPELLEVLDKLLAQDESWRSLKGDVDKIRSERNTTSEAINKAKKAGEDIKDLVAKAKEIPERLKQAEEKLTQLEQEIDTNRAQIPNVMHPDVPYGEDDSKNVEVKKVGEPKQFTFPVKNHVELCEQLGVANFEEAATTSGSGFYFLKGDLALLNQALIRFATDVLTKKGYTYVEPPLMVQQDILKAAMDMDAIEQSVYKVQHHGENEHQLALIGTAEHAILGMHKQQTLVETELPKKYAAYSMCFRAEIGSHGINEKGLWRTHQFNKVEQFVFCLPEQAWSAYDELLANSEEILQGLEVPYRVIEICTGDLAKWKVRSHDVEVWRPTTESYGEIMSLSNCGEYQAADLHIRYAKKDGTRGTVHTLNNTAMATSRIMVAILENFQEEDGSVTIPKVLQEYMGKEKITPLEKVEKW